MVDPGDTAAAAPAEPQAGAAEPVIVRSRRARFSLVWIVPIVALLAGGLLIARTLMQAGPDITIAFRNAEGIEPGRTEVRYKEVVVGRVTKVRLSPDRQKVVVSVGLDKSVENIAVDDTSFWVVRPRVGTAGISGLSTLFSGAYIGVDAGVSAEQRLHFAGLEAPPFVLRGEPGRSFVLRADDLGSLEVGSPVYYRRTRVGRVVGYALDPVRDAVGVQVFIESPHERLVTQDSRFWNASGIDVAVSASGVAINTQSIASVIAGGVAFANPSTEGPVQPATEGQRFFLFDTQKLAMAPPDGAPVRIRMVFAQSLRGLVAGAPVDLLGVEIGNVRDINLRYDPATEKFPLEVIAEIYPLRLGSVRQEVIAPRRSAARPDALFLKRMVENGMRAQVRTGNLLTGQLYVALDFVPKAARATLDESVDPPTIPSVPGTLSDLQPQIADIISRIGKVRFDEIGAGLQDTLKSASATSGSLRETLASANAAIQQLSPEAQRALAEVRQTLSSAQTTLDSFERNVGQPEAPLQRNANQALAELQRAARALRVLGDYLQQHPESILRGKPADTDPSKSGSR